LTKEYRFTLPVNTPNPQLLKGVLTMEKTIEKKKASWTFENGMATVTFPSGITTTFIMADLNQSINAKLVEYGFKQKLSDSLAGYEGSDSDKADLLQAMYAQLVDGEWTSRREAVPKIDTALLIKNLVAQGIPEAVAQQLILASKKEKVSKK
jgi:hypothetical protein